MAKTFKTKLAFPEAVQSFFDILTSHAGVERITTDGVFITIEAEDEYDLRGTVEELRDEIVSTLHTDIAIPRPQ